MSTYYDILKAAFPRIRGLDAEFYSEEPYKTSSLRRCKLLVLMGALSNCDQFQLLGAAEQNQLVKRIESGCVNSTIKKAREDNIGCSWQTLAFTRRYGNTVSERARDLDYTYNQYLAPLVVSGEINPYRVGDMTQEQLNPDLDRELKDKIETRKGTSVKVKTSSLYECPQCTMRMCVVVNVQLRGLDESKSTVAKCCMCPYEWTLEK